MRSTLLAASMLLPLTSLAAEPLQITPATATCGKPLCLVATGKHTSRAQIEAAVRGALGSSVELYEQRVAGPETGAFADSYTTTFLNTALHPKDATIEHVAGGAVMSGATHLLVKDGNHSPGWYLFKLRWDGTETISLREFWPNQGAISDVTLYGSGSRTTKVPEPGTMAMLGAGLLVFSFLRRRRAARAFFPAP